MSNKKRIAKKRASLRRPRRVWIDLETYSDLSYDDQSITVLIYAWQDENGKIQISKTFGNYK